MFKGLMIRRNQGSVPIILSFIVSAGVLSSIYITQKLAGDFFSKSAQSMEDWEKHLVAKSAQTLAGYLVTNNLVICREGGWQGKDSNCRWSMADNVNDPSDFHLSEEVDASEGLSYKGKYTINDSWKEYKVTFNLVNWKETSIQSLIGEIPPYTCRNIDDSSIISDATCIEYEKSSDPIEQPCQRGGVNLNDSVCEYISQVDSDYWIVLMQVLVDYKDPISNIQKTHTMFSGIRRPLSSIKFAGVVSGKRCAMACLTGSVANPFSNCRSPFIPESVGTYAGKASNIVTVKNEGPGSIYSLSLIRTSFNLPAKDNYKQDVTQDIVQMAGKEVFFPGDTVKFEYFYDCPIEVKETTVHKTGTSDSVEVSTQSHMVPHEKFMYGFSFNSKSNGVCYTAGQTINPDPNGDIEFILSIDDDQRLSSAECAPGASSCSTNGKSGICRFGNLEPGRIFTAPSKISVAHNKEVKAIITTITTSPTNSLIDAAGGSGDGADGSGGGGGCY